jgi:hypothetical protein
VTSKKTCTPESSLAPSVGLNGANAGGVVSRTVTANVPETEFLLESVTVHITVVVPIGNKDPDDGLHVGASWCKGKDHIQERTANCRDRVSLKRKSF